MKVNLHRDKPAGFAMVEGLLILVILAAIIGVGAYVIHQKNQANKTISITSTSGTTGAAQTAAGTTANIDQQTQRDAQVETSANNSADAQVQSSVNSANSATNGVGGAYNEAGF